MIGMRLSAALRVDSGMKTAEFQLWTPADYGKLKAILVLTPGSNQDGTGMVHLPPFKEFAEQHQVALIGTHFVDKDPSDIEGYCKAWNGSGQALLDAIDTFSVLHPQLKELKMLLWGHSAGGQWNYEMNNWRPDRVLGFVVNKGGIYYTMMCSERARKNPGLFFLGLRDQKWRQDVIRGLIAGNYRGGAEWILVPEDCQHDIHESIDLSLRWFSQLLEDQQDEGGGGQTLREQVEDSRLEMFKEREERDEEKESEEGDVR